MTSKEKYIAFCETRTDIPLFQQSWWMEIVSSRHEWDAIVIENESREIIAFLPYMHLRKFGLRIILQPSLSQHNGPWIRSDIRANPRTVDSIYREIIHKILAFKSDWFLQFFTPDHKYLNEFRHAGFTITDRRTYIISDLQNDVSYLFNRISGAQRRQIRKAERNGLKATFSSNAEVFYDFHCRCLEERGEKNRNKREIELRLCQKAIERGQGIIINIESPTGEKNAALFLSWDERTAYSMIPTFDASKKTSGASSYVFWQAMLYARGKGLKAFDFEGGVKESIGRFYSQFGTEEIGYEQVEKVCNPLIKLVKLWKKTS